MTISKNKLLFACIIFIFTGISCKNEIQTLPTFLPTDKAFVRFGLFSPGTSSVIIKVNDVKVNGAVTGGNGGLYPVTVNFADYAAVTPNGTFKLSLPNLGTSNDSIVIFNAVLPVESGKYYAVNLADTAADRTVFAILDNIGAIPDSGYFKIRLINAMPKTAPVNLIRIDSTSATTVVRDTIAKNISFKAASDYIKTPISPLPGYSFLRFRTVTTGGILLASVTPPATNYNQRYVTVYAYGYANGTGIYAPALSTFIYNQ
ncbi:MAG: DUF4397 domain-containing protein [Bacteroidota bacterium]|nr:DUF4397 domain-containing protein [Bacteroidota bacterium]